MFGKIGRARLVLIPLVLLVLLALRLLHPLPDPAWREASSAIPASDRTALGAAMLPLAAAHPGTSGASRRATASMPLPPVSPLPARPRCQSTRNITSGPMT